MDGGDGVGQWAGREGIVASSRVGYLHVDVFFSFFPFLFFFFFLLFFSLSFSFSPFYFSLHFAA